MSDPDTTRPTATGPPADELRRLHNRRMLLCVTLMLLAIPGGIALIALLSDVPISENALVFVAGIGVAAALVTVGLFLLLRRIGVAWAQPSPLLALPGKQRRAVSRALHRGGPVAPELRDAVAEAARSVLRTGWMRWLWLTIAAVQVLTLLDPDARTPLQFVLAVFWLGMVGYLVWLVRRARAFLATDPDQPS